MDAFLERLYPGRTREIRPVHDAELDMIAVIGMTIDEASAKIRARRRQREGRGPRGAGLGRRDPGAARRSALRAATSASASGRRPPSVAAFGEAARLDRVLRLCARARRA